MRIFHGRPGAGAVQKETLRAAGLDGAALTLLGALLDGADGQTLTLAALAEQHGVPVRRLHAAARSLTADGLLLRVKYESPGGRWATDLYVFPTPVTAVEFEAVRGRHAGAVTLTLEPDCAPGTPQPAPPAEPVAAAAATGGPLEQDVELVTAAAVREVLDALPGQLTVLLPSPLPAAVTAAVRAALAAGRQAEDLSARVVRRWWAHGYATKAALGSLSRPVGVAIALLRPGPCPDPRCEDGVNLDTGMPCPRCAERSEDFHRAKATENTPPVVNVADFPTPTPPAFASLDLTSRIDPETNAAGMARTRAALAAAKNARTTPHPSRRTP
ncbi:hypothetical protein [Streptomyces sp. NBC_01244]|uniref:hypothetical protein n=1 Tax=Streptomyces sp. NBC_01244 TaxID=2903797 RepID=UPI002E116BBE|nr:hypothetical protein OG247_44235 [Streptomyces sp. NBC_01244]